MSDKEKLAKIADLTKKCRDREEGEFMTLVYIEEVLEGKDGD